ncbi:putative SCAN domain-containing protein SCAND2P [Triplophysa rosa]|uniref:SCAN domain-containing protein SCAND2P n=1 Tax=Triplophysa rosa TaxID=992332 RepID=A0A9W7WA45_TRIRA|nr:putative SCAN domain-containing protein SCAND2P [Triplophysa rosa]
MQAPPATPFADVISSLAVLHREQHQALLQLRADQEARFQAILQAQKEDREAFRSWVDREVQAGGRTEVASGSHLWLTKMGPQDEPEAFLGLFEKAAESSGWPRDRWAIRLLPLLSGESQVAAQQLAPESLLVYDELRRAILQRVGRSPEEHRQRFRTLGLAETGRPFALAQQLRDSCRRWLRVEEGDVEKIVDRVVLEQFATRLPRQTAAWVQCHRPSSLDSAIQLAEDHLVTCPGVGEAIPSASLSHTPTPPPSRPVPAPRARPPGPPRFPPRGRGGTVPRPDDGSSGMQGRTGGSALEEHHPMSPSSPHQAPPPFSAARAAGRSGPACWRCGDPDHFLNRCPMMDVGLMVRVPDAPQAAPGQAGEYQIPVRFGGVPIGLWWIPVATRPRSTKA